MYKQLGLVLLVSTFIPLVKPVHAEVSVNINNSVNTNSNTSSTNVTQNSSGSNKTTIRVETNGEVHEFEAEGNESINWKSEDGNSSVSVNNNSVSVKSSANGETIISNTKVTPTPIQEEDKKSTTSAHDKEIPNKEEVKSFFETIMSFLTSLFK